MKTKSKLILASGSPRRSELLARAGYTFRIIVSDADETAPANLDPAAIAIHNAHAKASAVSTKTSADAVIIGADTIVVLDGRVYGKPADIAEARTTLRALSGHTHQVITGVCIVHDKTCSTFAETTDVVFRTLDDAEIDAYISTGEPFDKAGAYGIQGKGATLVDRIQGDYENVIGLPVARLQRSLDLECSDKIQDWKRGEQQRI